MLAFIIAFLGMNKQKPHFKAVFAALIRFADAFVAMPHLVSAQRGVVVLGLEFQVPARIQHTEHRKALISGRGVEDFAGLCSRSEWFSRLPVPLSWCSSCCCDLWYSVRKSAFMFGSRHFYFLEISREGAGGEKTSPAVILCFDLDCV